MQGNPMDTLTWARVGKRAVAFVGLICLGPWSAPSVALDADRLRPGASALLAIDQHRATVVERIVKERGDELAATGAGLSGEQLREMLFAMRADQLLAASLAGSIDGLRDVLAHALTPTESTNARLFPAKALGDSGDDVVYTPVTPCR